jgi:signal transduction histidine kinase
VPWIRAHDREVDVSSPSLPTQPMREFRWHVVGRFIVTAFLAFAAFLAYFFGYISSPWKLMGVCVLILGYNSIIFLMPWRAKRPGLITLVSLLLDVLALTSYLHFSGDIENPLTLAYSLPVVAGAVILSRRAGFLLAGLATFFFITLILMTTLDSFPIHADHHHLALVGDLNLHDRIDPDLNLQGWNYILTHLLVLMAVLFGSAHGFGTLSERVRETEQALRNENERLLLLVSILPEGVVLLGKDGTILHSNPAARLLMDRQEPRTIQELDPALGVTERFYHMSSLFEEFEGTYRDRTLEHALARRAPSGPIVWIFRDTTDQRRLMGTVLHRSKMIELGLLAAGIAHEIGNPLSSMSAILQIMEMSHPDPMLADRLRALNVNLDRIGGIVQDITAFARPSHNRRTSADARSLLEKSLQIFRFHDKAKEIAIQHSVPPDAVVVDVIEDQIVQVILNLLLNAADASEGRGTIGVSIQQDGEVVRIAIADKGTGIEKSARTHLFTPFFTTKEQGKGVGLGLFISESIARAHDGRIEVQSTHGVGSTFTLCLPAAPRGD